jgi:hypothetical protein
MIVREEMRLRERQKALARLKSGKSFLRLGCKKVAEKKKTESLLSFSLP